MYNYRIIKRLSGRGKRVHHIVQEQLNGAGDWTDHKDQSIDASKEISLDEARDLVAKLTDIQDIEMSQNGYVVVEPEPVTVTDKKQDSIKKAKTKRERR